jgi:G1/S-specific cyclin PLC1
MMKAAMHYMMRLPVTPKFISPVAEKSMLVVRTNPYPLSNHSFFNSKSGSPSFTAPVEYVSEDVSIQAPIPITNLAYLSRLRSCLSPTTRDNLTSAHRIFLAALILAANHLSDTSPKSKHWARYSLTWSFGDDQLGSSVADASLVEQQLLILLDWILRISPDNLHSRVQPVLAAVNGPRLLQTTQSKSEINPGHPSCIELPSGSFTKTSAYSVEQRMQRRRLRRWQKLSKGALQLTAKALMNRVLTT